MPITRQHAETSVTELIDQPCSELLAVVDQIGCITLLYLRSGDAWYRCFLDAGILFLDCLDGLDPADDLEDGQLYVDLAAMLNCSASTIKEFTMHDGILTFRCARGHSLQLRDSDDGTVMHVISGS